MDEYLRHYTLRVLGLSGVQCERPLSDRAVSNGDAGGAVQAGEASSASLSRTSGTVTERFDESAIGRAATIARMTNDVEIYGVETFGVWFRNVAAMHGYTVTVEPPSPGRINDPRR